MSVLPLLTPKSLAILSEVVGSRMSLFMSATFLLEDMAWETASPAFCIVPPRTDCMMLNGYAPLEVKSSQSEAIGGREREREIWLRNGKLQYYVHVEV